MSVPVVTGPRVQRGRGQAALALGSLVALLLVVPLGIRLLNARRAEAAVPPSYLPALEGPREREAAFDADRVPDLRRGGPDSARLVPPAAGRIAAPVPARHRTDRVPAHLLGLLQEARDCRQGVRAGGSDVLPALALLYSLPLWAQSLWVERTREHPRDVHPPNAIAVGWPRLLAQGVACGLALAAILVLRSRASLAFIYFQF